MLEKKNKNLERKLSVYVEIGTSAEAPVYI